MIQQRLLKDYGNKAEWSVASLFAHDRFIWELLRICNSIDVDVPIYSVYGSIPCLFNGGRIPTRDLKNSDIKYAREILEKYDSLGVSCRLTFSNTMIDDYDDKLSNELLEILDSLPSMTHGVIVADDKLADYIKDKYQNLYLISSIVKPSIEVQLGNDDANYYNSLFDLYDYVTINPYLIYDGKFLNDISHKDRVIFCTNSRCVPNCNRCYDHTDLIARINTKGIKKEDYSSELKLLKELKDKCNKLHSEYPLLGTQMSTSDIEALLRIGYKNFSIEGRDFEASCFIRDIGEYIFNFSIYDRIASSIMGGNI